MSFINTAEKGRVYAPGWFLADNENVTRKTQQISAAGAATADNGGKYVKTGTIWPSNDESAQGIVYEDVDVSTGDMPGSVVMAGTVYLDRLHTAPTSEAKTALENLGFKFISASPTVTRP